MLLKPDRDLTEQKKEPACLEFIKGKLALCTQSERVDEQPQVYLLRTHQPRE
jgi:hypothetical protein